MIGTPTAQKSMPKTLSGKLASRSTMRSRRSIRRNWLFSMLWPAVQKLRKRGPPNGVRSVNLPTNDERLASSRSSERLSFIKSKTADTSHRYGSVTRTELCSEYKFWAARYAISSLPKSARRSPRMDAEPTALSAWACRQPDNKRSTFAHRANLKTSRALIPRKLAQRGTLVGDGGPREEQNHN
jgi:hypothetical protein